MTWTTPPRTAEEFSSSYDSSIVVRRWGGTVVDFVAFVGLGVSLFALPIEAQNSGVVVFLLILVLYYPVLEYRFGATLGKLVCRIRVVGATGLRPTFGQALLRTVCRLIEVNPFLAGGIPAGIIVLASKKRQRLGDMAAGTFVLRREDAYALSRLAEGGAATALDPEGTPVAAPPRILPLPSEEAPSWLLPTGRAGWAIAAGYLGLFAVLLVPAPLALVAGILGLRQIRRSPGRGGRGRAIFGIVMGAFFSLALIAVSVATLMRQE